MNAKRLSFDDGATAAWACGKCRVVHKHEHKAVHCCMCGGCHKAPSPTRWLLCDDCEAQRREEWTNKRMGKLRKVATAATVVTGDVGPLFDPGDSDRICSIDEAIERMHEGDGFERGFASCSTPVVLKLDASEIVNGELEHLEIADEIDTPGFGELAEAIAEFNARQTAQWFQEDTARIVVLDRDRFEAFLVGSDGG